MNFYNYNVFLMTGFIHRAHILSFIDYCQEHIGFETMTDNESKWAWIHFSRVSSAQRILQKFQKQAFDKTTIC